MAKNIEIDLSKFIRDLREYIGKYGHAPYFVELNYATLRAIAFGIKSPKVNDDDTELVQSLKITTSIRMRDGMYNFV